MSPEHQAETERAFINQCNLSSRFGMLNCSAPKVRDNDLLTSFCMLTLGMTSLQTARHLVKQLLAADQGKKIVGTSSYLAETAAEEKRRSTVSSVEDWFNFEAQILAFRYDFH